ncbi:MAG: phosphotransferase [Defluviitaleaceae bacterium]|nr:phosphotransferase [Defluviitaleaceae bacterium]
MESLSKNKLSNSQINSLAKKAFGKAADEISENNIGEFSALYILKLAGKEVVLKIAPKDNVRVLRYEKNAMKTEVDALKLVKANTSVPVPAVLFYDTSKELCDSDYFFAEKINGDNFNSISLELSPEQNNDILFQLGKLNRQINSIEHSKFGRLIQPDKQVDNWQTTFMNITTDLLDDSKDLDIKLPVSCVEIESILKSFIFACGDVKTSKLVHWDLWQGNVLVKNNKITGIIDFERALYADVLMEAFFRKYAMNEHFCAGYGIDFSAPDNNIKIRLALYDLYIALIWVIEYYYRRYDQSQLSWREEQLVMACKAFESL